LGDLYLGQGGLEHAEKLYERVLRSKEKTLGPNHISTLEAVIKLGYLYASQDRLGNAEATYQRALRGYEAAFGQQYTTTLEIVHNLGYIYQIQGRLSDAETMYIRALRGYEKLFGEIRLAMYPPAVSTLECLANLLYELNRIEESRHYMLWAESGHDAIFGQLYQRCEDVFTTAGRSPKGALLQET
jgi:tetratricopeptide (TPR) repeat protein